MQNFLVEIGTEELPPKSLSLLAESFSKNIEQLLNKKELAFNSVQWYATPRRLAVSIQNLAAQQADKTVEKKGPAVSAAFDNEGNPTRAALGWAKSNGISVDQAQRLKSEKGEWLLHHAEIKGLNVEALLPEIIQQALTQLPIPKPMRWGDSSIQFIRPIQSVCLLYGEKLIESTILGIESSRTILGHRFLGQTQFELQHADHYLSDLKEKGYVIANYQERKAYIKNHVEKAAQEINGVAHAPDILLDEVTSLVEWPVILTASFDDKFLNVPSEALIYTMKSDQKYFPVFNEQQQLLSKFIFVSNIASHDPQQVISGNEKVIRPRLADAEFFFETDKAKSLESRLEALKSITFQKQLGNMFERCERIAHISQFIAKEIGANEALAYRAGLLSKADLTTEMVMEFPETQGIMGMHYAELNGEDTKVAKALAEQYLPKFSGDKLPESKESISVALAEKLDTLSGIFGIGLLPKADKDPFALRRAAIGILRIIIENKLEIDLVDLIDFSLKQHAENLTEKNVSDNILNFIFGRLKPWYLEQSLSIDVVESVLVRKPTQLFDCDQRIQAVNKFKQSESSIALAAANKRVTKLLSKTDDNDLSQIDSSLFVEVQEKNLYRKAFELQSKFDASIENKKYEQALSTLAELREPIDHFFDHVMVMADDKKIKVNRLSLLKHIQNQFFKIADISLLKTEK